MAKPDEISDITQPPVIGWGAYLVYEKSGKLVSHLENPDEFGTEFPVPSISKKDKNFGADMWRGPVWIII